MSESLFTRRGKAVTRPGRDAFHRVPLSIPAWTNGTRWNASLPGDWRVVREFLELVARSCPAFASIAAALALASCVHGGRLATDSLEHRRVLIAYRTEGNAPEGAQYFLVETDSGPAIFERIPGKTSALTANHWQEQGEDHFGSWISFLDQSGPAWEFVVPLDRSQPARAYIFPAGGYALLKIGGRHRPVPKTPHPEPAFLLIPVGRNPGSQVETDAPPEP